MIKVSKRDNCDRYYLIKFLGFGVFLHKIHTDEELDLYHNHPWSWISIIFGSYIEERFGKKPRIKRLINFAKSTTFHRITVSRPVWTLFLHFRRNNNWQVKNGDNQIISEEPWRVLVDIPHIDHDITLSYFTLL